MKKCVVIPDSFKGTMSAIRVCEIMEKKIREQFAECEVICVPVADGGEGTVDCFLHALDGERVIIETTGPLGDKITAYYAIFGETAVIEMASTAGITLAEDCLNPIEATTYGLGKLIRDALKRKCKKIILGLGGSCTNDGGVGLAASLGTKFYRENGEVFLPKSNEFTEIVRIDNSDTEKLLQGCTIEAMCDIDNPMHGKEGAAYIFAPQKGASQEMVKVLDENLKALDRMIECSLGKKVSVVPGSGAAGAMGAGVIAFLGGNLKAGIETVLDVVDFEEKIQNADFVFTGEGKIDSQSVRGKVIAGIGKRAKRKAVPVVVVAGCRGEGAEEAYQMGISAIFSACLEPKPFEEMCKDSEYYLEKTMDSILRLLKLRQHD